MSHTSSLFNTTILSLLIMCNPLLEARPNDHAHDPFYDMLLIGGGVVGGILAGTCLYKLFCKEKTDAQELHDAETTYHASHHSHHKVRIAYEIELELATTSQTDALNTLIKKVATQNRGAKYPFITYKDQIEHIINTLTDLENVLIEYKSVLQKRRVNLFEYRDPKMPASERAYFSEQYDIWITKFEYLKAELSRTLDGFLILRQRVSMLDEYMQERLLMRLDRLENRLEYLEHRPTNHYVYVQNNGHQALEDRLAHLENRTDISITTSTSY